MSSKHAPEHTTEHATVIPPGSRADRDWSIVARLTAWNTAAATILVLLATGSLYLKLRWTLDRLDDQFMWDQVHIMRGIVAEHGEDRPELAREVREFSAREHSFVYIRVIASGAGVLAETSGMRRELPAELFGEPSEEAVTHARDWEGPEGRPYRLLCARLVPASVGGEPRGMVQVGLDRTHHRGLLSTFGRWLLLMLGLAILPCALVGHWIAARGLRPVERISRTAHTINSATLHERIPVEGLPSELQRLAAEINRMLARLEDAFERLSRFSADIAHELRTPVSILRGEVEVALGQPRSVEEYQAVLGSSLEEFGRLTHVIESLLFIARVERQLEAPIRRTRVDVRRELAHLVEFYEPLATEAGLVLELEAPPALDALVDRTLLQRAVANLIDNAIAHTAPEGRITVRAFETSGALCIQVEDTGCGIDAQQLPKVADRFYRADEARTSGGNVGLGLTIVKSVVSLHGGTMELHSELGVGTKVELRLPAAQT